MTISLERYLMTGRFGDLHKGMTLEAVIALLGESSDVGGTSRRHRRPSIYLYGSVEIYVTQAATAIVTGVFWDAEGKGVFRLNDRCHIADWEMVPRMPFAEVEAFLRDRDIPFDYTDNPNGAFPPNLRTGGGVYLCFDVDDGGLGCISRLS